MKSKTLNFIASIFLSLVFFQEYSYSSKEQVSDSYESIITRDFSMLSRLFSKEQSSHSSFEEWSEAVKETLVSLSFSYEKRGKEIMSELGISLSKLEERLSNLLAHTLNSSDSTPICPPENPPHHLAFYKICKGWAIFGIDPDDISEKQDRLVSLVSALSQDIFGQDIFEQAQDMRDNDFFLQRGAYSSLLLFAGPEEKAERNFIALVNALIKAGRLDLLDKPLEEYCALNNGYKTFSNIAQLARTFVGHERLDYFITLLESHALSLKEYLKKEQPSEEGVEHFLVAYKTFLIVSQDEDKNKRNAISNLLFNVLQNSLKKLNSSSTQYEFVLRKLKEVSLEFGADGILAKKAYSLSESYLESMDKSKSLPELSLECLESLCEIYYHYALALCVDGNYREPIKFIREICFPFIAENQKKNSSLWGWWEAKKAGMHCLLCLAALKERNYSIAMPCLEYIDPVIPDLEEMKNPMLPYIKAIAGTLWFENGKKQNNTRQKLKGKVLLSEAFNMIRKKFGDAGTDDDTYYFSPSSNLVFFISNGLEEAGMRDKAIELSEHLIKFNLKSLIEASQPQKSGTRKNASPRKSQRDRRCAEYIKGKIKEQQDKQEKLAAQQKALDRKKELEASSSAKRQTRSSIEKTSQSDLEKKEPQIVSPNVSPEPETNSDSNSQKPKKEKIKTRKAPLAGPSSSSDDGSSISASEENPASDAPKRDLGKYLYLLKDETFCALFQLNKGKITLHDFTKLLGDLGGRIQEGKGSHKKATMPQEDFFGRVLTIPNKTEVKLYMLDKLKEIFMEIGLTPDALEKYNRGKQKDVRQTNL